MVSATGTLDFPGRDRRPLSFLTFQGCPAPVGDGDEPEPRRPASSTLARLNSHGTNDWTPATRRDTMRVHGPRWTAGADIRLEDSRIPEGQLQ